MSEEHDFGEEFYSAYAAGSLDPALTLLIETQAALRSDVRKELQIADALSGRFLETEAVAPLSFRAAERALEAIDALDAQPATAQKASKMASKMVDELIRLPEPLQEVALQSSAVSGWKYAGKGLRILPIEVSQDVSAELLRIEPGCGAPMHTHEGS